MTTQATVYVDTVQHTLLGLRIWSARAVGIKVPEEPSVAPDRAYYTIVCPRTFWRRDPQRARRLAARWATRNYGGLLPDGRAAGA